MPQPEPVAPLNLYKTNNNKDATEKFETWHIPPHTFPLNVIQTLKPDKLPHIVNK